MISVLIKLTTSPLATTSQPGNRNLHIIRLANIAVMRWVSGSKQALKMF